MDSCQDASFDIFSRPPTDHSIQEFHDQEIHPLTAVSSSSSAIDFTIAGEGDEYIDLSELRLHLRVKITSDAATGLDDGKVSLVKFWPHALFRQCDLLLNGTLVTTSSNMYHYIAYIASLLSFPKEVRDHQLSVLEHSNGWEVKKGNPESEAFIRLHLPLCNQPRLIPNGVTIKLRLLRNPDEFVIIKSAGAAGENISLSLEACSLFVRRITPTPTILLDHAETLSKTNCIFPIQRIWGKCSTLTKGSRDFDLPNITQGPLPDRVIVSLVTTKAFSGSMDTDPFKFEHFGLEYIHLIVNGRSIPAIPITADFNKDQFRRAYHLLLDTIQGGCSDSESLGISLSDYKERSCFFGFTLAKTLTGATQSIPRIENGYVNMKLRFASALKENVNIIFFMEYSNFVELDNSRNCFVNYPS